MNIQEKIGEVIDKTKSIEYQLNCMIHNIILPTKNVAFFQNVILNSSVIPLGAKLRIIKSLCINLKLKQDFDIDKVHRIINIRNLFAHESSYVDTENGDIHYMDELKSDGKYISQTVEKYHKEFNELFEVQYNRIVKFNETLSQKCQ